ncbi:MAG: xanthine dehydrogenase family protein subunit M [Deltaproteobacteria bacterium]|nr:xanthine dehydrogenase family protein subunit M [Deltaproteobacteria bacterium]
MENFGYVRPANLKQALALLGTQHGKVALLAGGTDLLGEMKDDLLAPERLVSLQALKELRGIRPTTAGLRIGAATRSADLIESPVVQPRAPLLAMAAAKVGTPQLRNMATLGGNLCQRPRCWYFRNNYPCLKRGGDRCYALAGENQYHAILEGGPAFIVHPSDTAPALVALGARVRIAGPKGERTVPLEQFFVLPRQNVRRENILQPTELLTEVQVPTAPAGARAIYVKEMEREIWDFALASVAALVTVKDGVVQEARIVLGGVAPIPYRAAKAEAVLKGQRLEETVAAAAGEAAVAGAKPLAKNGYKVPLTKTLVKRALLALA